MKVIGYLGESALLVEIRPPANDELPGEQPAVLCDVSSGKCGYVLPVMSIDAHTHGGLVQGVPAWASPADVDRAIALAVAVNETAASAA